MFGLLSTSFLLSLLSVVSSTSEYPKRAEGWYPSSGLGNSASEGVRDRRTTHWESRSHSNLDDDRRRLDDDRDGGGHGQNSYPLLVDQLSPMGVPTSRVEVSASRSTNEIDFSDEESTDNDSRLDHCVTIVRKPIILLSIDGARRGVDDARILQLGPSTSGRFGTIRCRRRIQGWMLQEPVYVEEPRWVLIEPNRQFGSGHTMGEDDPFYVARGKRSPRQSSDDSAPAINTNNYPTDLSILEKNRGSDNSEKNQRTILRRGKRDALGDVLLSSLAGGQEPVYGSPPGFGADRGKGHAHGYVSPRNKHSDILDILNEPFFISRGKKDSMRLRRYEWINRYAKKQILGGRLLPIAATGGGAAADLCDPRSSDCIVDVPSVSSHQDPRSADEPIAFRDRRGVVEDILKEADPFYLARGKRSPLTSAASTFDDDSNRFSPATSSTSLHDDRTTSSTRSSIDSSHDNLPMVH